jgi:hypothetical protein
MNSLRFANRSVSAVVTIGFLWSCACAPTIKRDLSKVPAGQIGFDDLCGLQTYYDDIESKRELPPTLVDSTEFEAQKGGHALRTGRTRFAFQGRTQLAQLRRVLDENWSRMPESVAQAPRLDLDVYWSERDGLRRVSSSKDAVVIAGSDEVVLPYHVCLSELLYGAPLYHQRREVMQLPPLTPEVAVASSSPRPPAADGGAAPGHVDVDGGMASSTARADGTAGQGPPPVAESAAAQPAPKAAARPATKAAAH